MQVSFLIDKHVGIFDGCASILRIIEVPLQKVEDCLMLFRVHPMIFEESDEQSFFSNKHIPKEGIEGIFNFSILFSCNFLYPFSELFFVVDPKRYRVVSEPIPAHLLRLQLSSSFFFV